jgi:heme-degrading monooxygenase HmoA
MIDSPYCIVWEFRPKSGREAEFEKIYGPAGDWAMLFKRAEGYLGTELFRSRKTAGCYLTVDRWVSPEAFVQFKQNFAEKYRTLDARCESLTEDEKLVGEFNAVP